MEGRIKGDRESNIIRRRDFFFKAIAFWLRWFTNFKTRRLLVNMDGNRCYSVGSILEENAKKYPEDMALMYRDLSFTHREFNEWINRYANYFLSRGLRKDNTAVVMLENRPEMMFCIGALAKIGAIASLINPNHRGPALLHSIRLTPAQLYIIGEELIEAFAEVRDDLDLEPEVPICFLSDGGEKEIPEGYVDLKADIEKYQTVNPPTTGGIRLRDPFVYIFTSGTTGMPKASLLQHSRWVGGCYWFGKIVLNLNRRDSMYICLPLYHSTGLSVGWTAAAGSGAAVALSRKFSVSNFWKDIGRYKATAFCYIGELCRYLMNQPPSPDDRENPVQKIIGNGLRTDIWRGFKERFAIPEVYEFYGNTETKLNIINLLNLDCTVGKTSHPHVIVKYDIDADEPLRDERGLLQKAKVGEPGLLLAQVDSELFFGGYTNAMESEKKIRRNVFEEGDAWFDFGDLLRDVGHGFLQFVDRLGDTFRWKGENVSTTEVEAALNSLENIKDCTVYGVTIDGTEGRVGMASIISDIPSDEYDFRQLLTDLRGQLAPYAVPIFLRFQGEIVTTETFKHKKSDLKREGFDLNVVTDPIYVLLPGRSDYVRLTPECLRDIRVRKYRF
jgi:citronellyl-CoA synthetase